MFYNNIFQYNKNLSIFQQYYNDFQQHNFKYNRKNDKHSNNFPQKDNSKKNQ